MPNKLLYRINLPSIFKHRLLKNSLIYSSTSIIRSAIPFLLLPILTRYLNPDDYGIVATYQVLLGIAFVFVNIEMHGAISVNYFKLKRYEFSVYIGNVISILIFDFIIVFLIVLALKKPLSILLNFPEKWLSIIIVTALAQSLFLIALTLWQVEQKPVPFGISQISHTIINVTLSLFFVLTLRMHWQGRLYGIIISSVFFGLVSIYIMFKGKYIKLELKIKYLKDALNFGVPLIPHALSGWIMTSIDRLFINSMVNITETGLYSVGYQVGMIINIIAASFNQAWVPYLFEKLKENSNMTKIKIVKFTYLYNIIIIIMAIILGMISPWIFKIFINNKYYAGSKYVLWISLGYAANGMYLMVVNYIYYVKKTKIIAAITMFTAGINLLLNYLLIPINGPLGAAQASAISFVICFIITWIASSRLFYMPWNLKSLRSK